ncbi:TetR/AcrR family transcriptional regulator [Saccharopolyspora erythraea]|uniref:TetR/AcrR family transcriptional regulator n=1 Tax=Saccharopolyspora erythraea TaxID=1836 RepID=UPI001BA69F46|nr:TetR/AcrR family transcriptional regulator [Saccharopolyspora erythraea]QUH05368.1 TetR/AcrR family transcriptional regulator [Saccharopolyspora erythraea]
MPKRVDHAARREQIADALIRIASREGLEGVSLRDVAAEAGVSMGAVQHYFGTKEQMLLFATTHANGKVSERVREHLARADIAPTPREVVRTVMIEMLPVSPEGRSALLVSIAFMLRALNQPEMAEVYNAEWPKVVGLFTDQLRAARGDGLLVPGVDPEREAELLLAVPDGLAAGVLLGRRSGDEAIAVIDYHLDRIFRS